MGDKICFSDKIKEAIMHFPPIYKNGQRLTVGITKAAMPQNMFCKRNSKKGRRPKTERQRLR